MEIKRIDREQIKESLIEKGYVGKLISYEELQELYTEYGRGMSELDFAQGILGISYSLYMNCKHRNKKARLLNYIHRNLSQQEVEEIVKSIKERGYAGKLVTYEELHKLWKEYANQVYEESFAQKVLGISYSSYVQCKNRGSRIKVLKDEKLELSQEEVESIVKSIQEKGYMGQLVTYEKLHELYEEYGKGIKESEFALILGISYGNYMECKNQNTRIRLLKDREKKIQQEEIEEIVKSIKERGYAGKFVTYEELQELYKEYGKGIKESEFAQILGISYNSYVQCKNRGSRTKILRKSKRKLSQEEVERIVKSIKERGYAGKLVTYEELQELYKEYGKGIKESEFAQILGISYIAYTQCKNRGSRTEVLKELKRKLSQEEVERIVKSIEERGYAGKLVTYEELRELYEEYGKGIKESEFAQILGISYSAYAQCKSRGSRTEVLKELKRKLSQEEVERIVKSIEERGYAGKLVTYEELQELYKEYGKGMKELEFAKILGISYSSYVQCKNRGSRTEVLKWQKGKLSEEQAEEIVQNLKKREYIGKAITYEELHELYEEYGKEIKESEFAQILGISYANYHNCKNRKTRAIIRDGLVKDKVKEIMLLYLGNSDWYSREFINNICKEYDITFEDFITYVGLKGFFDSSITEFLKQKDKIWIGNIRMSEEFTNSNVGLIEGTATHVANIICKKYGKNRDRTDYEQEVIIYMIENMGAIEKNFGDNLKLFRDIIFRSTKKYCEYMIFNELRINKYVHFGRLTAKGKHGEEIERQIADERVNIEQQVVESETKSDFLLESERCIKLLSQYIEEGCNRSEALEMTAQTMGVDTKTMLEYMQQYLVTNGKVRTTKRGTVEWYSK